MLLQFLIVTLQLLLLTFWIDICCGQIIFPRDATCTTPNKERENCVRWSQCLSMSQKIRDWEHLRPFLCGFAGTEPKVCCQVSRRPNISDPPSERGFPTSNLSSTPSSSNSSPNNSSEKPIFLPDYCGSSIFMHNKVIGGQKAEKGNWPWMAVVLKIEKDGSKNADCGGALVTARHVITAAHCMFKRNSITSLERDQLMVRMGVHDLSNENDRDVIDVGVDALRIHEKYDQRDLRNDIAVLRLIQPVPLSDTTAPVCLPYDSLRYEDLAGKSSTVTGFGQTEGGAASDVLMEVSFEIQDQEMCRRIYERTVPITKRQLCAGALDGSKDSCAGDSGGPLVTVGKEKRYYLVGIVSFGKMGCANPGYPGVYTRVTEYLDWLKPKLAD